MSKSLHDYRGEYRAARKRARRLGHDASWADYNDAWRAVEVTRHAHSMAIARYIMRRDRDLLERLAR